MVSDPLAEYFEGDELKVVRALVSEPSTDEKLSDSLNLSIAKVNTILKDLITREYAKAEGFPAVYDLTDKFAEGTHVPFKESRRLKPLLGVVAQGSDVKFEEALPRGLHVKFYVEAQSNIPDAVPVSLGKLIDTHFKDNPLLVLGKAEVTELTKLDQELYSGIVEVEFVSLSFHTLVGLVSRMAPSAIEILAPNEYKMPIREAQGILADVSELTQSFSHELTKRMTDQERQHLYIKSLHE